MTFVVTEKCIQCKHTDCAQVCPVNAFHEGVNFLAINPDDCIDCNLCLPECPVGAIYSEDDLPEKYAHFININGRLSQHWPKIHERKSPMINAEYWANVENKTNELIE